MDGDPRFREPRIRRGSARGRRLTVYDPREEQMHEEKVRVDGPVVRRSQRVLTVEDLASRREEEAAQNASLEVESSAVVEVRSAPSDPEAALRHARIGFVAVAALVLLLVWIMQKKGA